MVTVCVFISNKQTNINKAVSQKVWGRIYIGGSRIGKVM
jgi:hypothetical protein